MPKHYFFIFSLSTLLFHLASSEAQAQALPLLDKFFFAENEQSTVLVQPQFNDGRTNIAFYAECPTEACPDTGTPESPEFVFFAENVGHGHLPFSDYWAPDPSFHRLVAVEYFNDAQQFTCSDLSVEECVANPHFVSQFNFEITDSILLPPLIGIEKVPEPLALPEGSGPITYAYTVWNAGEQPALTDVSVTDDQCSPVEFLSGDLNGNGKLEGGESWNYRCATTLSQTTTNTATATGFGDDRYRQVATAARTMTVVVGPGLPDTGSFLPRLFNKTTVIVGSLLLLLVVFLVWVVRKPRVGPFVIFFSLCISGMSFVPAAQAGTLACTVRTSTCSVGEVEIFEMENTTNAHAGLPAASYTNLVCCGGVTGLSNSCSGTFATALKLSGTTNAHGRQGTLADYPSATNACLSVPGGGSVSVGYQATNCTGFDTTLGSMIGTTNSHVGDGSWANGTTKICATAAGAGSLAVDIVDADGNSVVAPSIALGATTLSLTSQTVTGAFGASSERLRVNNTTLNPQWTLTLAADDGPTALWSAGAPQYDFNDPTGGATDGGDTDAFGGQMTIDPSVITLGGTCSATGVTKGSSASFSEGPTNSITLITTGATANTDCYWDFTGVGVSQTIPVEQTSTNYALNMTLTIAAY